MKNLIKNTILEYNETTEDITQAIYIIDGIYISGEFDCGIRGVDHNCLLDDGYDWSDLLNHGTVIVPEEMTYISDVHNDELDELGYTMMRKGE